MIIQKFIARLPLLFPGLADQMPWEITGKLSELVLKTIQTLDDQFIIQNDIAVHRSAVIEQGVVLKGPVIIGPDCFVGAHAYLRGGIWLDEQVKIGPGCELKTTMMFAGSAAAHFNFIGDSLIGSRVNFEAGSVVANHWNERTDKQIRLRIDNQIIETGVEKFGALAGDGAKIGANAVLSPGTVLEPGRVVKRLGLIE